MNRNLIKPVLIVLLVTVFFSTSFAAKSAKETVLFVADSVTIGNKGTQECTDFLKIYLNSNHNNNKYEVLNYSFFDLNTSQAYTLIDRLLEKDQGIGYVVLMAGEGNFYNLDGYTGYLKGIGAYQPSQQAPFIQENDIDSIIKLNTGIASIYNSPLAHSKKALFKYVASMAYRSIAGVTPKRIDGYVPKTIPSFTVLTEEAKPISVMSESFINKYKIAWELINTGKIDEAESTLKEMLIENPFNSNIYYTLGTLYLLKDHSNTGDALKLFFDGILVNPFDKTNQCYKGLSVMFMSYNGREIQEILYFAKIIQSYLGDKIPEINSIIAINSEDYDTRVSLIKDWIIYDIKKIEGLCKSKGVKFILSGYPYDARSNSILRNAFGLSSTVFVDNFRSMSSETDINKLEKTAKNIAYTIQK